VNARRAGAAAGIATLIGSGAYVFIYLYRWEWNRAQVSAAIFVAAEVGLIGWLLADRLRGVERRLDALTSDAQHRRLEILRSSAPAPKVGFRWMASSEMSVFIPVLLGAGAVLSAMAWVVERLSRATAGRVAERGLAGRLATLDLPSGGLLEARPDPVALLRGPRP
jgi:hypothetical protein